jgi:hypothetical protein
MLRRLSGEAGVQQIMLCSRVLSACTILQLQASPMNKDTRTPLIGVD